MGLQICNRARVINRRLAISKISILSVHDRSDGAWSASCGSYRLRRQPTTRRRFRLSVVDRRRNGRQQLRLAGWWQIGRRWWLAVRRERLKSPEIGAILEGCKDAR